MDQDLTLQKVLGDIQKGMIVPCYLLYGDEDYLVKAALHKIINEILPEADRGMNLLFIDGENESVVRLCESLLTPPLVPGRKMIVLRNTRLLYSRQSLPELVRKIRETVDRDPVRAAKSFMVFIKMAGWTLGDLKDGNWKSIREDEWERMTGEDANERGKWLPKLIDLCAAQCFEIEPASDEEEISNVLSKGLPESNCLVVTTDIVDKRKRLFKLMSEKGIVLNFHQAKGEAKQKNQMFEAAKEFLQKRGRDIEPSTLLALGRKTGFDIRKSIVELEKLIAYIGEKPQIEEDDVNNIVGKTKEISVFDLTAALMEKNTFGTLLALRELLDQGVHHLVILAMIVREFRFLLHAKVLTACGQIANFARTPEYSQFQKAILPLLKDMPVGEGSRLELLDQHPYVIFNALRFSERFSREELSGKLEYLLESDLAFKTTGQDPQLAMERLIIRLCNQH